MILSAHLDDSLSRLKALLADADGPWWIIGSVAVALHGGNPGEVRDVDVILGHADAERCFRQLKLANFGGSADPLFRSDLFARWLAPPVPVELMAGLRVNGADGWRPLAIHSREEIREGIFVPARNELRAILTAFGREKDLRRAATLG